MKLDRFIAVGENIHCTRIFKTDGTNVVTLGSGGFALSYLQPDGKRQALPIPPHISAGAEWAAGKVRHCAVAVWQGLNGDTAGKQGGIDYLASLAWRQAESGATYLDVNVDEFSAEIDERIKAMKWTADVVQAAVALPLSIDSSHPKVLEAGLRACRKANGRPMVNSVSLERLDAVGLAAGFNAVVIASAAGEKGLPATVPEKLDNIEKLLDRLTARGLTGPDIHIDPLVFPISTDSGNGRTFLEAVSAIRHKYGPAIHIVGGLSNVSFGMPNRKLINQAFAYLAVEAGADGGIVDPLQLNAGVLNSMNTKSEPFALARAMLLGEDEFGMNFIAASREGRI